MKFTYWFSTAVGCWLSNCKVCRRIDAADTEQEAAAHKERHKECYEHNMI